MDLSETSRWPALRATRYPDVSPRAQSHAVMYFLVDAVRWHWLVAQSGTTIERTRDPTASTTAVAASCNRGRLSVLERYINAARSCRQRHIVPLLVNGRAAMDMQAVRVSEGVSENAFTSTFASATEICANHTHTPTPQEHGQYTQPQ